MSDMDVEHALYDLLDQSPAVDDVDLVEPYMRAAMQPPITHESLSELDIARIINNPKLRHDVNFDRELHFRPNLDGSRGKHKLKAADDYWKALIGELELYRLCGAQLITCDTTEDLAYWSRMMNTSQKRMPGMFETIKEVIKTLVPEKDQATVAERLDVAMIMQEISKGVFDMMSLAQWLARLLKAHCAPMRDEWIDQMVTQTQRGLNEGCQKRIVLGLRQLLGILEAMKLDVANHQIRHLRGLLIDDAINFQQRYQLHRFSYGRLDIPRARRWFEREQMHHLPYDTSCDKLAVFSSALFRSLLSQSSLSAFPESFQLDSERLRSMRHDLHHLISLDICCDVFDMLLTQRLSDEARDAAKTTLKASLADIVGDSRRFVEHRGNIAVEIVRFMLHVEGQPNDFDADLVELAEQQLKTDLPASSLAFTSRAKAILEEQSPKLCDMIKAHLKLTTTVLHEIMVPALPTASTPFGLPKELPAKREIKSMDDILRRMTHVAVLHWHIWSPMVYNPPEEDILASSPATTATSEESDCGVLTPMTDDMDIEESECEADGSLSDGDDSAVSVSGANSPVASAEEMDEGI